MLMEYARPSRPSVISVLKELCLCAFAVLALLMMDRSLENLYPFFLYGTGKRIIDLWIAFEMHMHVWLKALIPAIFAVVLFLRRGKLRTGLLLPILGVYLVALLTSLLASGYTFRWWNTTELPLMMYLFLTVQCSTRRGVCRLAFCGNCLYILLLVLNAVFCLFPVLFDRISGWRPDYFLSADNLTGFPMVFGFLLAFLDGYYNGSRLRKYTYLVLFFLNLILIRCFSALMAGLILAAYLWIPLLRRQFEKRSLNLFTALSLLMCAILTGLSVLALTGDRYETFSRLLTFKMSLIVRFILWKGVFEEILLHPFLGYGLGDDASFYARPNTSLFYNAHNAWLQTWHEGGLVLLLAVVAVLFLAAHILRKAEDRKLAGLFTAVIFAELIMMQTAITAWFVWAPLFMILLMASLLCTKEASTLDV